MNLKNKYDNEKIGYKIRDRIRDKINYKVKDIIHAKIRNKIWKEVLDNEVTYRIFNKLRYKVIDEINYSGTKFGFKSLIKSMMKSLDEVILSLTK